MKNFIIEIIKKIPFLKRLVLAILKIRYSKKYQVKFGKGVYINNTSIFEGQNFLSNDCYFVGCEIGFGSYVGANSHITKTQIGKYCSIGPNVRTIMGQHPTSKFVSTHPSFFSKHSPIGLSYVQEQLFEEHPKSFHPIEDYTIAIGNDVWIGDGAALIEGVTVGNGAIIAANALVTKDVPPYAIIGGVPGKIIKYRFSEPEIANLLKLAWWDKSHEWIQANAEKFQDIKNFKAPIDAIKS